MEAEEPTSPILAVKDLILARGGKRFAKISNLAVSSGQAIAIVGPSGCGKTTALLALAGIRPPASGTITIEGTNPWKLRSRARDRFRGRRIGLVFQSFHLVDALSVGANVWLAAQCAGYPSKDSDRLGNLLERLELTSIKEHRVDHISHGEAQRVAIARALLNRPALILADEPTSALDDGNTRTLMALLKKSAIFENASLVIASHDRRIIDTVDRVVEMEVLR